MISRRAFTAATAWGLAALPVAARAQPQPAKVPRVGFLGVASEAALTSRVEAFRAGLRELGYAEGKNLVIEYRWADGNYDRLPDLAADLGKRHAGGVVVTDDAMLNSNSRRIAEIAEQKRLSSAGNTDLAEAGGLIGYGVNVSDMFCRAAYFVDKIVRGAKPGDLPVERATKFDLVINLKTAKALGVTIPPSVLGRADHVIQP